ncbi:hypothetical protein HCN44_011485 [Aphidius gifuensis]|uniref:Sphingomyelin phosphodiesterase 4 n=1 Tax=Aphidius gifuensis TaxID=684658 RepID=A0A834XMU7_APHGI|nr:hypothetical protein HCN44_011485 [Aphidius gifuensis]
MTNSADVAVVRMNAYLNLRLIERCRELENLIDESSTAELQLVFPALIDSIFGLTNKIGWGLHNISLTKNPHEYEAFLNFLGPTGPIFSLCYKLLPDCYLKYDFPVSYLPTKIRTMLEEGIIPPFYSDKLKDDQSSRLPQVLSMNPYEYYIFHFAYHLSNPGFSFSQQKMFDELGNNLRPTCQFIFATLLPRDNSTVLPLIGPYEHHSNKCLSQVWRSETVVQVFGLLLEYTEEEKLISPLDSRLPPSLPRRHSIHSGEHIRLVRAFIKTLHEFANSSRESYYHQFKEKFIFLRKAIHHWPLDSSFRLILEAWLSFIQPWRYVRKFCSEGNLEGDERGKINDPSRWMSFVANNLLAYTAIFEQLLPRFIRTDLVAPKNALMLFRVTKVFSQPHLAEMLIETESCMDDANVSRGGKITATQWSAIVKQQILELEGPNYKYNPMFSESTISKIIWFLSTIKQAHLTATSIVEALEKRRLEKKIFLTIWEFFNGEESSTDDIGLTDRKKVPGFLLNSQQQIIEIFQIRLEDTPRVAIVADQEYHDSILSTSFSHQSQFDSSVDTHRPGVFVRIQEERHQFRYIEYMGDPEVQPVRSNECAFLVRTLYKICEIINSKYEREITNSYWRNDMIGRMAKRILQPPTIVRCLPKRTSKGFTLAQESELSPRLSLRILASYNFLVILILSILVFRFFEYGTYMYIFCLICWTFYTLIETACNF